MDSIVKVGDEKYRILSLVLESKHFSLARAILEKNSKHYLIKIYNKSLDAGNTFERLEHEYALLQNITSVSFLRPLQKATENGDHFLILEDLEVSRLTPPSSIPSPTHVFEMGMQLCMALADLHRAGYLLNGVRFDSLLFSHQNGALVFSDLPDCSSVTQASIDLKKNRNWEYSAIETLSPEHTNRVVTALDFRSDLYTLGTLLFYIATGRFPFESHSFEEHSFHLVATPSPLAHLINQQLPESLSFLINKLLQKNPTYRYQSAEGVFLDLKYMAECFNKTQTTPFFTLGQHDLGPSLYQSFQLFGRQEEYDELSTFIRSTAPLHVPLLISISGEAGIGKTTFATDLCREFLSGPVFFAASKCQFRDAPAPYDLFYQLMKALLYQCFKVFESQDQKEFLHSLKIKLGENLDLLISFLPEAAFLSSEAKPTVFLNASEKKEAFFRCVCDFLSAFATGKFKLTLFIDDLHWVDEASMDLLSYIFKSENTPSISMVVTFREKEMNDNPNIKGWFLEFSKAMAESKFTHLSRLSALECEDFLTNVLGQNGEHVLHFSMLLHQKSLGNPLHLLQCLLTAKSNGDLSLERESGEWKCKLTSETLQNLPNQVGKLLALRIGELSLEAQNVLKYCACMGIEFSPTALSEAMGINIAEVMGSLHESERLGLVFSVDTNFRFVHDLVWEAVCSSCPLRESEQIHLQFARYYRQRSQSSEEMPFPWEVARHYYSAMNTELSDLDRNHALSTHMQAGQLASEKGAFHEAFECFKRGLCFFKWPLSPEQKSLYWHFRLLREECLYLTDAKSIQINELEDLLFNAEEKDKLIAHRLAVDFYQLIGEPKKAIELGLAGLSYAGLYLEFNPTYEEINFQYEELCRLKSANPEISFSPDNESKVTTVICIDEVIELLSSITIAANVVSRDLMYLLGIYACKFRLLNKLPKDFATGAFELSFYLLDVKNDPHAAWANLLECYEQMSRTESTRHKTMLCSIMGGIFCHWVLSYKKSISFVTEGLQYIIGSSDLLHGAYCRMTIATLFFYSGKNLKNVLDQCKEVTIVLNRIGFSSFCDLMTGIECAASCLTGKSYSLFTYERDDFVHEDFLKDNILSPHRKVYHVPQFYFIPKILVAIVRGSLDDVKGYEEQIREVVKMCPWFAGCLELPFLLALSIVMRFSSANPARFLPHASGSFVAPKTMEEEEQRSLNELKARMAELAVQSPENCKAKEMLVLALLALDSDNVYVGEELLDKAIEAAKCAEQTHYEAIGNEWAAYHYLSKNRLHIASSYLNQAMLRYAAWGAHAKVEQLQSQNQHWFSLIQSTLPIPSFGYDSDLVAVINSSQTLSSQTSIPEVASTLLRAAAMHSGADRALLFFVDENGSSEPFLSYCPQGTSESSKEPHQEFPLSIVNAVLRSQKYFLLHAEDSGHVQSDDPYFMRHSVPSVLCLPIVRANRTLGVLLLENHVSYGVFTQQTLEKLNVLLNQAAISIENARLYERQQKIQVELSTARDAAEQASRIKSEFLACLSHEIRTPLNAILGFNELLQLPTFSPQEKDTFLEKIQRNCTYLLGLIDDLLDLSRIERGEIRIENADFSPTSLIHDVISDFQKDATEKGLTLRFNPFELIPPLVRTDPFRFRQILQNILGNAVKFTDHGFVHLNLCFIHSETPDSMSILEVVVQDSGRGIEGNQQARIFEPFAQAHSFLERKHRGMGIGLDVSRRIARILGGNVTLNQSTLGVGSEFVIRLPVSIPGPYYLNLPSQKPVSHIKKLQDMSILVADDAPDNCLLVTRILELAGAKVCAVSDGEAAVSKALLYLFDAIILDIQMPIMNGFEAAREIRKIPLSTPLIALSAHVRPEEEVRSLQEGFDAHLCKPIRSAVLIQKIESLVKQHLSNNSN